MRRNRAPTNARGIYVAMTRGRHDNAAYITTTNEQNAVDPEKTASDLANENMGYRRPFGWGIAFEGLVFPLWLQGKRLVAKTPPRGLSHLGPILLATKPKKI